MNFKSNTAPKKKDETNADLEQQFVLRLPPGTAMALKHDIESGSMNLKDKLMIEMQPDMRHGRVMYGGQIFPAKLLDLPCIIESLKSTDNKTFYKTADVSQIMVCNVGEDDSEEEDGKKRDKKYQYPHGITPPLKNVRKRRFRRTLKKKNSEMPDIEKEVKRLFRTDNDAIDVKWEVVIESDKSDHNSTAEKQVLAQGEASRQPILKRKGIPLEIPNLGEELAEHDIFGDVSDSDDDEIPTATDGDIMKEASKKIFGDVSDSDNEEKMDLQLTGAEGMEDMGLESGQPMDFTDELQVHQKLQEIVTNLNATREKRIQMEEERDLSDRQFTENDEVNVQIKAMIEQENEYEREYQLYASMINQG